MRPLLRPLITCFFVLAALMPFLLACSNDEPVDPGTAIHQSYEMEYDVARNRTTGRAALRLNNDAGAQQQVTSPTDMLYNAAAMIWANAEPFSYTRVQSGRIETGTFAFTDVGGIVRTNTATLGAVEEIALPLDVHELPMSSQAVVAWQGAAVSNGETVTLVFNTPANGLATFYEQNPGATSITLTPSDLAQLGAGTATWRLERVRYFPLQATSSAGGRIAVRWSTGDQPIIIR